MDEPVVTNNNKVNQINTQDVDFFGSDSQLPNSNSFNNVKQFNSVQPTSNPFDQFQQFNSSNSNNLNQNKGPNSGNTNNPFASFENKQFDLL